MKHFYKFFAFAVVMGLSYGLSAQVIIHEQDFEAGAGDWILEGAWQVGNVAQNSSQYWVYPDNSAGNFASLNDDALGQGGEGNGLIVSPELDFSEFTQILLTFETHYPHANYAIVGPDQHVFTWMNRTRRHLPFVGPVRNIRGKYLAQIYGFCTRIIQFKPIVKMSFLIRLG